jgi:hypothetical protein
MLYIKEFFFTWFYFLLLFLILYIFSYLIEEEIICLIINLIPQNKIYNFSEYYFFYNKSEAKLLKFGFSFCFSIFLIIPFLIKKIYLYYILITRCNYIKFLKNFRKIHFLYYTINIIFAYKIVPYLWGVIDNMAQDVMEDSLLNIESNCGLEVFIEFFIYNIFIFNLNLSIHFLFLQIYLINYHKLEPLCRVMIKVCLKVTIIFKNVALYLFVLYSFFLFDTWFTYTLIFNIFLMHLFNLLIYKVYAYKRLLNTTTDDIWVLLKRIKKFKR